MRSTDGLIDWIHSRSLIMTLLYGVDYSVKPYVVYLFIFYSDLHIAQYTDIILLLAVGCLGIDCCGTAL